MGANRKSRPDALETYRTRRVPEGTPEPFGEEAVSRPGVFVVQKHAARRVHYDLRLEWKGTLLSWAVPKGPSLDPAEKRLAVETEPHPVEYADFEGIIPEGNYGAGSMIVWDQGRWVPLEDAEAGLEKGKLLFELKGHKLRGVWTLFRTRKGTRDWMLVKKPDAWADPGGERPFQEESVFSGLRVEELRDASERREAIRRRLEELEAPRRRVSLDEVSLMLARTSAGAFSRKGWIFELKYDGFRMLAEKAGYRVRLKYRSGLDASRTFPEICRALAALPFENLIIDGEVAVLDETGRPSFQLLQRRGLLTRSADIERATVELAATFFVFDLPALDEFDLRPLPLLERKALLETIVPRTGLVRYADHVEEKGKELLEEVEKLDLEGIMAKNASSSYQGGRSGAWLKIRADRTGEFVIVGYTEPQGSREGLGALHLGCHDGDLLVYAGRVGTGLSMRQLRGLKKTLSAAERPDPPCSGAVPRGKEHHWVEPRLACRVRYRERTEDGLLRQPSFVRLLEDWDLRDCRCRGSGRLREEPQAGTSAAAAGPRAPGPAPEGASPASGADPAREQAGPRKLKLTNRAKVFWPGEGFTKGDLLDYYRAVSSWVLPYLKDRPLALERYPDGIEGKSFFQKNPPDYVPAWIRTERLWVEDAPQGAAVFICQDRESLLYLANLGTIPLHVWSSRLSSLDRPDWCILDLDPKEAPFRSVVVLARAIQRLCESIELECFVKTSGSTGLHVLIPLGARFTYVQSRTLADVLARVVVQEHPQIATTTRMPVDRGGRVYIDCVQNGQGRLLVAPFSVRPLPGAPVSTPLRWSEVNARLDPHRFNIKNVPRRMSRLKEDPLAPVLARRPDLLRALELLLERLPSGREAGDSG